MSRQVGLTILAVVLFLVALVLVIFKVPAGADGVRLVQALTLGGLASFAAAHLP